MGIVGERNIPPWPHILVGWSVILYPKRLRVQSQVGVHVGGNQSMFPSLSPSPAPFPLSLKPIKNTSLGEDKKKKESFSYSFFGGYSKRNNGNPKKFRLVIRDHRGQLPEPLILYQNVIVK